MSYRLGIGNYNPTIPCGLGCPDCGGTCNKGLGLFDSGLDFNGWGFGEWAVLIIGGYALVSMLFTTSRGVSAVRRLPGERRKARAAAYRKKAAELTKKK